MLDTRSTEYLGSLALSRRHVIPRWGNQLTALGRVRFHATPPHAPPKFELPCTTVSLCCAAMPAGEPPDFDGDEEAVLQYAIELSLQPPSPTPGQAGHVEPAETPVPPAATEKASSGPSDPPSGLLGLDRYKMEQERLQRRNLKRVAEPPESEPAPRRLKSAGVPTLPFSRGVVKRTWCKGQPRLGDDITIDEVLQRDELQLAVLSSYQWDDQWLLSKVDMSSTKTVLIAYAADARQVCRGSPSCDRVWSGSSAFRSRGRGVREVSLTSTDNAESGNAIKRTVPARPLLFPAHEWARRDALQAADPALRALPSHRRTVREPCAIRLGRDGYNGERGLP